MSLTRRSVPGGVKRAFGIVVLMILLSSIWTGVAFASSVSTLKVTVSSTAGGATLVSWNASFTLSGSGALTTAGGSTVMVAGPTGTTFSTNGCDYRWTDLTNGTVRGCLGVSASSNTVTIAAPVDTAAGDRLLLLLTHTTNPAAAASMTQIGVHTSSDTTVVHPASGSFTTAHAPGTVSLAPTSSADGATAVRWGVRFTASATGALINGVGQISVTGPTGTVFSTNGCDDAMRDLTTGAAGGCPLISVVGTTVTVTALLRVSAGDDVMLFLGNTANPSGSQAFTAVTVKTSSDTAAGHPSSGAFTTAHGVSSLAFTPSTTAGRAQGARWKTTFKTSATGGLVANYGQIVLTGPTNTVFSTNGADYGVRDQTNGNSDSTPSVTVSGTKATITVKFDVPAGDTLLVTASGMTNPDSAKTFSTIGVSTTSDRTVAHPASGTFTAANAPTGLVFTTSSPTGKATGVRRSVTFKTSATGALVGGYGQIVAIFGGIASPSSCDLIVRDLTNGNASGSCPYASITGSTIKVTVPFNVPAGDTLGLYASGFTNPIAGTAFSIVKIHTTSDLTPVGPSSGSFTTANSPGGVAVAATSTAAGATGVRWSTTLTTSATGALVANYGKVIIKGQSGTVFSTNPADYWIRDVTAGVVVQFPSVTVSSTTVTILVPFDIPANHVVSVHAGGTTNPGPSSFGTIAVSTTSDTTVAHPSTGAFAAANAPGSIKFAPTTTAGGATGVKWGVRFTTSASGGLVANYGQISLSGPAGAVFSTNGGDYAIRDLTNGNISQYLGVTVNGTTATVTTPFDIPAGHQVAVFANGTTNPAASTVFSTVGISTTSDKVVGHPASGTFTTPKAPTLVGFVVSSKSGGTSAVHWDVTLTTSSTGAMVGPYAQMTVTGPSGTSFSNDGCQYTFQDVTASSFTNCLGVAVNGTSVTVSLPAGEAVSAGDQIDLGINNVTNPGSGSAFSSIDFSTSSDRATVSPSSGSFS